MQKNEYKDYNNFAVTDYLHILYIFIISSFLNINVILIGKYFKWNRWEIENFGKREHKWEICYMNIFMNKILEWGKILIKEMDPSRETWREYSIK